MTIVTKTEFAKQINRSHQYVSSLKNKGRLVLIKKNGKEQVDLEKSLDRIAATADPANDPAQTMPRSDGRTEASVGMQAKSVTADKGANSQYQTSRAVKESYSARMKKLEYEREAGELVHRDGVNKASFQVARILRDKLIALPARLAPKVTVETDQKQNFKILTDEVENVIREIQDKLSELRQ